MHAVVFEVLPKPERRDDYLALAAALRPELERIDGFLSVERFASRQDEGKILSFSLWRDEAALVRWRSHRGHRGAQDKGRFEIFRDYRLRVGEVVRTLDGAAAMSGSARGTEIGGGRASVVIVELDRSAGVGTDDLKLTDERGGAAVAWESFASLYTEGRALVLTSWADESRAQAWLERTALRCGRGGRLRLMAVGRDYGMFDRAAAPRREAAAGRERDPA